MTEDLLKKSFILYICLTLVEYGLTAFGGSLLKIYGYLIIALWLLLKQGNIPRLKKNKPLLYMVFYLIFSAVTLLWSVDLEMGSYYFLAMANMIVLIAIASTLCWNSKDVAQLLTAFQISAAVFSVILLVQGQTFEGSGRATLIVSGNQEDPNNIAAMLLIPAIISIWKILKNQGIQVFKMQFVVLNYLFFGLDLMAMLMLGSRGALISVSAATIFLLLFNNKISNTSHKAPKSITFFKTLILIGAVLVIVIPYVDPDILHRLTIRRMEADKGSDRLIIWQVAIKKFYKSPFSGIGLGSFQAITQKGVHNQYLIALVETGIPGFLLFAGSLISLFRRTLKSKSSLLSAMLVGTMVVIFFLDSYNKKFFWNPILISMIVLKMKKTAISKKFLTNNESLLEYSYLK